MFDKLFLMVGPLWASVALLALLLAYFAFVAAQTARFAAQGESPARWRLKLRDRVQRTAKWLTAPRRDPDDYAPYDSSPQN